LSDLINGTENIEQAGTAHAALVDFYRAFNQRDSLRMAECWLHSDVASMSNPLGGIKRGWEEIGSVYENIFNGPAQVYVEFYDFQIYETDMMFCAVGRERGYLKTAQNKIELAIRTSRVYLRQQGRWLQLHHHGSIDQAELLGRYQKAVLEQTYA
jgi:hypothetical protein